MKYKRDMERKLGMDNVVAAPVVGLNAEARPGPFNHPAERETEFSSGQPAPAAAAAPAAVRDFGAAVEEDEDDDIYN